MPNISDDDYIAMMKKVEDSGMFPGVDSTQGMRDKISAELEQQHQQAPWMALADAGFKMASGTSPFFATNMGAGFSGIGQELRQQQTDYMKEQLELAGMASKEAEAEATRRVNIANVATKFIDAKQRAAELAMNSQNQYYERMDANDARRLGYAELAESRNARLAQTQDTQTARYYAALTTQLDTESRLADQWDKQFGEGSPAAMMGKSPGVNPHLANIQAIQAQLARFTAKMPGAPQGIQSLTPAPAAANPRDPLGLR
jgi:hypothetical protein